MVMNHGRDLVIFSLHLVGIQEHCLGQIRADLCSELQEWVEVTVSQAVEPVGRVGDFVIIAHPEALLC